MTGRTIETAGLPEGESPVPSHAPTSSEIPPFKEVYREYFDFVWSSARRLGIQRRTRAPVSEQPRFDLLWLERFAQERVTLQVDHADCEVVAGAPVGVHERQLFSA